MSNKSSCALCGIAEVDDIKFKACADCDLVRYCSDECQKKHISQHKKDCKSKKRAAELRDELLFKQPESSHHGDCPICMLPLPLDESKSSLYSCCSKMICDGCYHATKMREEEASLDQRCPFCRTPIPSKDEADKQMVLLRRMKFPPSNALSHPPSLCTSMQATCAHISPSFVSTTLISIFA